MHKAVILRRGPAKQVCTLGWDLATDQIEIGQWLKGRIYEQFCYLSPDGKYFIYFALKARDPLWSRTAISRAPYLKAVCLWKTGSNSGGGLFRSTNTYWVNNPASLVRDSGEVQRDESEPDDVYRRIWRGMYFRRLIRDGWNLSGSEIDRYRVPVRRFEKKINDHWILRRIAHEGDMQRAGQAYAHDEYVLVEPYAEEIQNRLNWDWADINHERLLWAEGGKIFTADIEAQGLGPTKMLYDLNDMTFQKIEAPY